MKNTGPNNYSCAPDSLAISFYSCLLDLNYDLNNGSDDKICESGDSFTDYLSFIKIIHLLRSNTTNNRKILNEKRNTWRRKYCKKYIAGNEGRGFCSIETFLRPFCEDYKGDRDDIPLIIHFTSTFKCIVCQKNITIVSKEFDVVLANYGQNNNLQMSLDYFSNNYLRRTTQNCPDCDPQKISGDTAKLMNSVINLTPNILIVQMNAHTKNIEAMNDDWKIIFGGDVYCIRSIIWNDRPSTHFVTTSYFSGYWHYFDDFDNFTSQVSSPISKDKTYCNSVLLFLVKQKS